MATLLADRSTAPAVEQAPPAAPPGPPPQPAAATPLAGRDCANCGSPMGPGQDWCLQCGAGAPGSLGAPTPSWRSGATILLATLVLVLGATAAGYAALSKGGGTRAVRTVTQAAVPPPSTPAPGATTTPGATPLPPKAFGTPSTVPTFPKGIVKPPKIPLTAILPKVTGPGKASPQSIPTTSTPASTTPLPSEGGSSTPSESPRPASILLDTNAASSYNPAALPASDFGDPSLAIDGDISTAWTAQVDPASAPNMAAGLLIDLKSPRRLSALGLITTSPGMTVQVFGALGQTPPATITDPAWTKLSSSVLEKKRHQRIKLQSNKPFRFVTLWISKVPAASLGTPQAPGHVSLHEVELFPAA